MLGKAISYGLSGIKGYAVSVEVDIHPGMPNIEMVGLPDTSIRESKERVRSAVKNSGYLFSPSKVTINLAPADTKKEGSIYDLSVAVAFLAATDQVLTDRLIDTVIIGELSLDGSIRSVKGILPILLSAVGDGFKRIIIPLTNANEASYVDGAEIFAVENLRQTVNFLNDSTTISPIDKRDYIALREARRYHEDFKYVKGQFVAKRAMEIAAAGGHNILLIGPPGAGKTMLAKCIPSILPKFTPEEALETTKIHSIAGTLDEDDGMVVKRPFRTPHHTVSRFALTGGGTNAKPGEISLAHNGVLFLDEMPEYPRSVLEILRQPLEDNVISVTRMARTVEYPANFMLVASMNPCPCGNFGSTERECTCTPAQIHKYLSRLSGPLMDRIDLHIEVDCVTYDDLSSTTNAEPSSAIRDRVDAAREIQLKRFQGEIYSNARMNSVMIKKYCALDKTSDDLLKSAFERLNLSARAYTRILKVSRTIADLEGAENITSKHIAEAIQYRSLDRSYWK